ncbi:MAG: NAD(P)-dependent oxidoreductase [Ectobacillus sp.]
MRICLFGATGRVGMVFLKRAIAGGAYVTALARNSEQLFINKQVNCIKGNVLQEDDVRKAARNCDIIVSALGTDGADTLSKSMPFILKAMEAEGIKRLITVGTAGILQARTNPSVYRFQSRESRRKSTQAAEDHLKAYLLLKQSNLDWTIVCPTHLIDGEPAYLYRVEKDMLPVNGERITVGDTAHFIYQQLHSLDYNQTRVGIAY